MVPAGPFDYTPKMLPDLPLIARVHSGEVEGRRKISTPDDENKNSTVGRVYHKDCCNLFNQFSFELFQARSDPSRSLPSGPPGAGRRDQEITQEGAGGGTRVGGNFLGRSGGNQLSPAGPTFGSQVDQVVR